MSSDAVPRSNQTHVASSDDRTVSLQDLRRIPGVGASIAGDLYELGYRRVGDLSGEDPQVMYDAHCAQRGMAVDRCLLYTFRCAVYFAETAEPEAELLKWWNWKDRV